MDWHPPDLDKDPTPGDPQRVRTLAAQLHDFAHDVSDALRLVKGMADEDTLLQWAGKSAEVFKEQLKDVPKNLKKLVRDHDAMVWRSAAEEGLSISSSRTQNVLDSPQSDTRQYQADARRMTEEKPSTCTMKVSRPRTSMFTRTDSTGCLVSLKFARVSLEVEQALPLT
ncbi:hypothetical protein [Streptomyces shenzhenensis]|uniref:hypothetical protein n=1 Tax=Streptomyces shenzhenensis TaxID=943815 RepID=UPI0015F028F6|nr:hypothetical protein [Streptomyces shenzhenensis]